MARDIQVVEAHQAGGQLEEIEAITGDLGRGQKQPVGAEGGGRPVAGRQELALNAGGNGQVGLDLVVGLGKLVAGLQQVPVLFPQALFQGQDALANPQARPQYLGLEGFGDEVIGPGIESLHQVGAVGATREQDDVGIVAQVRGPHGPTKFGARHAGHHPVTDHQPDVLGQQQVEAGMTVLGLQYLVTPAAQQEADVEAGVGGVINDQDFHVAPEVEVRRRNGDR